LSLGIGDEYRYSKSVEVISSDSASCDWDFRKRARALAYEIERLSKSQFSSVGIQASFVPKAVEGDWGAMSVSKDGIGFLAQFLRELN
jgi:hypothetical protein